MTSQYIERMEMEHKELAEKSLALAEFIHRSKVFDTLENQEKVRMIQQLGFMQSYAHILDCRIHSAKNKESK
ncbi:MAG TPA: hypothetical protein DDW91_17740 [Shewanella frigidimarina]|nr:hypothetical protein [Shewanella frigidimarina]